MRFWSPEVVVRVVKCKENCMAGIVKRNPKKDDSVVVGKGPGRNQGWDTLVYVLLAGCICRGKGEGLPAI